MPQITTPHSRRASAACENFIKGFERLRLHGYLPTPDDVPTIGWGATGPGITLDTVWTADQANERFAADLKGFAAGVDRAIGDEQTTQSQFDAMVSMAFNCGMKNFLDSTLLKRHTAGCYISAAEQFIRWNKQNGRVLAGLVKRRLAEAQMYRGQA